MNNLQLALQSMIISILTAHYSAVLSIQYHTQRPQSMDGQTSLHESSMECSSMWFEYNQTTHNCQCIPVFVACEGEIAYANTHLKLTYDSNKEVISAVKMSLRHKYWVEYNSTVMKDGSYGIVLPENISELNNYMCGPLNRKNYLCSDCKSGYGPAIIFEPASCANECYSCEDTWYNGLLYLALNFIFLIPFCLFILVFQVKLTSAPVTCFIMYSQLVVLAFYKECSLDPVESVFSQIKFSDGGATLRTETKILLTMYGIFNLDFFHYVLPPLCISSQLRPIHIFFLGYISAFYPFLLILLTWFCVELHGHNFRPIVCLWRPFHGCFACLRRGWNTKSDLIDVFASFFLLSYCKTLYQIMLTFDFKSVTNYSLTMGRITHSYILTSDFTISTFKTNNYFILLACCTLMLILFFLIFPLVLLFFYPTKVFRNLLSKCCSNRFWIFLNTFIEKFQCCYRDRLGGGRDMRSLSGIYFLLRITLGLAGPISRAALIKLNFVRGFILSVVTLLIALSRPYKKLG